MRALLAFALAAVGCSPGAFACDDVEDCQDGKRSGACQPDGFCSFPDDECPSGQRYGSHAGDLSGLCVMPLGDTGSESSASPTSTLDPTGLDVTTVSATSPSETSASDAVDDTTLGMTTAPGSSDESPAEESSTSGDIPAGPELALWLELEDASFSAGFVDSGPFDLLATCASDLACPTAVPGRIGQGAEFHGSGECIVVPHDDAFADLDGLTVSAWVQLVDLGGNLNRMIVGKRYGDENSNTFELYYFDVVPADELLQARFAAADIVDYATASSPRQTPTDVWTHVAGTWDGVAVALWLDGVQISTSPLGALAIDDHEVRIGCDDDLGGDPLDNVFVGVIDDVRIYREALDPEQIAALATGDDP